MRDGGIALPLSWAYNAIGRMQCKHAVQHLVLHTHNAGIQQSCVATYSFLLVDGKEREELLHRTDPTRYQLAVLRNIFRVSCLCVDMDRFVDPKSLAL